MLRGGRRYVWRGDGRRRRAFSDPRVQQRAWRVHGGVLDSDGGRSSVEPVLTAACLTRELRMI